MNGLRDMLQQELERIHHLKDIEEKRLEKLSDLKGKLRISSRRNEVMYYHRIPGGRANGEYIPKKQIETAARLAQKTYDEKVLEIVKKREQQFSRILRDYEDNEVENIYLKECLHRKELIKPVEPTWEQKVEQWLSIPFQGKPFAENAPNIFTNRGERVRSKSEKILADFFDSLEIPYKYECPLYLKPYGIVYPDFTLLSRRTGKEVYWEHEGMMDQPEYARSAVKKIDLYQSNGIMMGDRLILTFETSMTMLNTGQLKNIMMLYGI